jgi:L-threonylcarbamoyladenylate synthase
MSLSLNQKQQIQAAIIALKNNDLVVIPTETVYGLAANATSDIAVEKIFKLKGRPSNNPLICHVADLKGVYRCIDSNQLEICKETINKLSVFWPGPLTIVVPKSNIISSKTTAGGDTVGIRIPNHEITLELLKNLDFPLAAPSANKSDYVSPTRLEHVYSDFGSDCPLCIEGGISQKGIESTVLSLIDLNNPKILRPGIISADEISAVLKIKVEEFKNNNLSALDKPSISPGLSKVHYSPKTPLKYLDSIDFSSHLPSKIGLIAFSSNSGLEHDFSLIKVISDSNNLYEISSKLYDALRELDNQNLDLILIDSCKREGIGIAIMDRLDRAIKR